ncbi:helix-turn-helix domain-containing protein [Bacteroides fragilis]
MELGKSENTVSRWTTNRTQPSVQQLCNIAAVLNIDVRCLLTSSKE